MKSHLNDAPRGNESSIWRARFDQLMQKIHHSIYKTKRKRERKRERKEGQGRTLCSAVRGDER